MIVAPLAGQSQVIQSSLSSLTQMCLWLKTYCSIQLRVITKFITLLILWSLSPLADQKETRVPISSGKRRILHVQVVFEILSPGNTLTEINKKQVFCDRYGVEEYYLTEVTQLVEECKEG